MKTHLTKLTVALCAVFLVGSGFARAGAEANQGKLEAALHDLQEAKTKDNPGQLLHEAKEELDKARHNKHGFRIASLDKLDEAISAAAAGDKQKMIEKIDATIADVHDAMAHAPGSR